MKSGIFCLILLSMLGICGAVYNCRSGYYSNRDGICTRCNSECKTCSINSYYCTTCPSGYIIYNNHYCKRNCYEDNTYLSGDECKYCDSSCKRCDGGGKTKCTACSDGKYLSSQNECKKCHSSCTTCNGEGRSKCTTCSDTKYLSSQNKCKNCHSSCTTCSGKGSSKCTSCPAGYVLSNGKCDDNCPEGEYISGNNCEVCDSSCKTCKYEEDKCTSCDSGYNLESDECIRRCSEGKYEKRGGQCEDCHSSCKTCNGRGSGECTSCDDPDDILIDGKCMGQGYCNDGEYETSWGSCKECSSSCRKCYGRGSSKCTACKSGKHLNDNDECK